MDGGAVSSDKLQLCLGMPFRGRDKQRAFSIPIAIHQYLSKTREVTKLVTVQQFRFAVVNTDEKPSLAAIQDVHKRPLGRPEVLPFPPSLPFFADPRPHYA